MDIKEKIKRLHLDLAENRGVSATYCPSEVARKLNPDDWRKYMDDVRKVADELIKEKRLVVLQKGNVINAMATELRGPIRLRLL